MNEFVVSEGEPIQGFLHCPFGFAQGPVEMTGFGLGGGGHTLGLKPHICGAMRPKAEALGYSEAKARIREMVPKA